jgi:deazaflavin-dependent oxidoreductase (nitroreductase family)
MTIEVPRRGTRGANMPGGGLKGAFTGLARGLYRLGLGRRMDDEKVVLLSTRGARSGKQRTTPVMAFPDGDAWLVVASYGGAATHPDWFVNLARNPDDVWVEVDGRRGQVRPATLQGEEKAAAWKRIVERSPRFAGYQEHTDREIPVVRLTPA